MEVEEAKVKPKKVKALAVLKKVDMDTAKAIQTLKDRANKKTFGRKVKDAEILALAVKQLNSDHILSLQEATYSEKDRLSMAFEEYQKVHGKLTMDQFIGRLLKGEIRIQ